MSTDHLDQGVAHRADADGPVLGQCWGLTNINQRRRRNI